MPERLGWSRGETQEHSDACYLHSSTCPSGAGMGLSLSPRLGDSDMTWQVSLPALLTNSTASGKQPEQQPDFSHLLLAPLPPKYQPCKMLGALLRGQHCLAVTQQAWGAHCPLPLTCHPAPHCRPGSSSLSSNPLLLQLEKKFGSSCVSVKSCRENWAPMGGGGGGSGPSDKPASAFLPLATPSSQTDRQSPHSHSYCIPFSRRQTHSCLW